MEQSKPIREITTTIQWHPRDFRSDGTFVTPEYTPDERITIKRINGESLKWKIFRYAYLIGGVLFVVFTFGVLILGRDVVFEALGMGSDFDDLKDLAENVACPGGAYADQYADCRACAKTGDTYTCTECYPGVETKAPRSPGNMCKETLPPPTDGSGTGQKFLGQFVNNK